MKKVISFLFLILLSVLLISCSDNIEKKEEANYVVVKIPKSTEVDDLFEFESVSKSVLNTEFCEIDDVEDGCYCIGTLQDGNSIIWKSDDDGSGYDDCLFIYVKDKISDTQIITYAAKLKETPISYESFKRKINDKRKEAV